MTKSSSPSSSGPTRSKATGALAAPGAADVADAAPPAIEGGATSASVEHGLLDTGRGWEITSTLGSVDVPEALPFAPSPLLLLLRVDGCHANLLYVVLGDDGFVVAVDCNALSALVEAVEGTVGADVSGIPDGCQAYLLYVLFEDVGFLVAVDGDTLSVLGAAVEVGVDANNFKRPALLHGPCCIRQRLDRTETLQKKGAHEGVGHVRQGCRKAVPDAGVH